MIRDEIKNKKKIKEASNLTKIETKKMRTISKTNTNRRT
jgi:hypothetical protein